jgi:very-short-patch-repair endonuclease
MKNNNDENQSKRYIEDPKTIYLVKTLSRTKRKDYENYVINAIWNKLDNDKIEVISQQYINNPNSKRKDGKTRYFIDLYFPKLNIGIECDEAHHLVEKNKADDKKREKDISSVLEERENERRVFDALHDIKVSSDGYHAEHIDVTLPFDEVQRKINNAVEYIQNKYNEIKPDDWHIISAEDYFKGKEKISIRDNIGFKSISQACNILFATGYSEESKGRSRSYFTPWTFIDPKYANYNYTDCKVWFPKLAVKNSDGDFVAATWTGFNNQLNEDGTKIIQKNDKVDGKRQIVFAKYKDPLGGNAYKFVGIFESTDSETHTRKDTECKLIRK